MLIWIRKKKDNLFYTILLAGTFIALLTMIYISYQLGVVIGFSTILMFLLAIVWNE